MAQVQRLLFYQFDPDSSTVFRYGKFGGNTPGFGAITSAGSSTTITSFAGSLDSSKHPFVDFAKYTMLGVQTPGGLTYNWDQVQAVASDTSITIGTARDYTVPTTAWWVQKFISGTTVTDGFVGVDTLRTKLVKIVVTALTSTAIDYSIEAKLHGLDAAPTVLYQGLNASGTGITSAAALSNTAMIQIPESCTAIRVGLRAPGGPNTTDKVNVYLIGQKGAYESAN